MSRAVQTGWRDNGRGGGVALKGMAFASWLAERRNEKRIGIQNEEQD